MHYESMLSNRTLMMGMEDEIFRYSCNTGQLIPVKLTPNDVAVKFLNMTGRCKVELIMINGGNPITRINLLHMKSKYFCDTGNNYCMTASPFIEQIFLNPLAMENIPRYLIISIISHNYGCIQNVKNSELARRSVLSLSITKEDLCSTETHKSA